MNVNAYIAKFIGYRDINLIFQENMLFKAFLIACMHESKIDTFLIFKNMICLREIFIFFGVNDLNCFLLACKFNYNLEVIKFLINDLNFDTRCEKMNLEIMV